MWYLQEEYLKYKHSKNESERTWEDILANIEEMRALYCGDGYLWISFSPPEDKGWLVLPVWLEVTMGPALS